MKYLLTSLFCLALMSGCDSGSENALPDSSAGLPNDDSEILVVVNGTKITRNELDDYLQRKFEALDGQEQDPADVLQEMINVELLHQEAIANGYDKMPDVIAEARLQTRNLIVDTFVLDKARSLEFSDEQLRAEYDEKVAALPKYEYRARHILVNTEEEARDVISTLDGGGDFATLAAEKSIDPTSSQGGDLGWFRANRMVDSFADAVRAMEVNQTSIQPVKSEFGWHVIRLEEKRETAQQVPEFEQVKERMRTALVGESIQSVIENLRAQSDIKVLGAP